MPIEQDTASTEREGNSSPPIKNCARCRYPLDGLPDDAPCPECGSSLRQTGPQAYRRTNLHGAITCLLIGILVAVIVATSRFWPILVAVPILGIITVIYGELDARDRRRAGLSRSYATVAISSLGWIMFVPLLVVFLFIVSQIH